MSVHYIGKPVFDAYQVEGAIERPCPACLAEALVPCTNPITGAHRKCPCLLRLRPDTAISGG